MTNARMTNTQAWDRVAARRGDGDRRHRRRAVRRRPADRGRPAPAAATSRASACSTSGAATGENAIALARQGAHVIALDVSTAQLALGPQARRRDRGPRRVARGRRSPTSRSCAPTRSTSRSRAGVLGEVEDLDRLLPPGAPRAAPGRARSCSPTSTRCALAVGRDGDGARRAAARHARGPALLLRHRRRSTSTRDDEPHPGLAAHDRRRVLRAAPRRLPRRRCSSSRSRCARPIPARRSPTSIIWRARKEGV